MGRTLVSDPLLGIRFKLQRACEQLDSLKNEMATFLDGGPYEPSFKLHRIHRSKDARFVFDVTIRMLVKKPCEPMWGIIIGEIVHNFRSALDHAVYPLSSKGKTQFPIFIDPSEFDSRGLQMLSGMRPNVANLIKTFQPFATGESTSSPLWHLNELSNFDKHRTIHLMGGTLEAFNFRFPPLANNAYIFHEIRNKGAFKHDAEIARARILSDGPPFEGPQVKMNAEIAFNIVFDQRTPVVGEWAVIGTLLNIADRTAEVLERFSRDIFKVKVRLARPSNTTRRQPLSG